MCKYIILIRNAGLLECVCLVLFLQYRFAYIQGFDVGDFPDNINSLDMPIRPYYVPDKLGGIEKLKMVENCSKLAMDKYNKDNVCLFALLVCFVLPYLPVLVVPRGFIFNFLLNLYRRKQNTSLGRFSRRTPEVVGLSASILPARASMCLVPALRSSSLLLMFIKMCQRSWNAAVLHNNNNSLVIFLAIICLFFCYRIADGFMDHISTFYFFSLVLDNPMVL